MPIDLPPKPKIWLPPRPAIIRPADDLVTDKAGIGALLCAARRRLAGGISKGAEITAGTAIGSGANLTRIFDGTDDATRSAGASSGNVSASAYGYGGLDLTTPSAIFSAECYGPNNFEWFQTWGGTMTITLRGSTGAVPSTPQTDGDSLGTASFASSTNEGSAGAGPRTIISTDNSTVYDNVWMVSQNETGGTLTFGIVEFNIFAPA